MKNGILFWGEKAIASERNFKKSKFYSENLDIVRQTIETAIKAACKKHNSEPAFIIEVCDYNDDCRRFIFDSLNVGEYDSTALDSLFSDVRGALLKMIQTYNERMFGDENASCAEDVAIHCFDDEVSIVLHKCLYYHIRPLFNYSKDVEEYSYDESPKLGKYIGL